MFLRRQLGLLLAPDLRAVAKDLRSSRVAVQAARSSMMFDQGQGVLSNLESAEAPLDSALHAIEGR